MQEALFGGIIKTHEENGNKEIFALYRKVGGVDASACALLVFADGSPK